MLVRASMAIALATAFGGVAAAYERGGQEILSALPDDAPPGECYARVRVPGGPVQGPPQLQGAQWVLNPGPPGSPGPIWCLVPTGPAPVAFEPDRYGFIRVLCDDDLTRDRVTGIQRKLHDRGYYRGSAHGRYDRDTADAVRRFQSGAHIDHGGYLSMETVKTLEGGYADAGYGQPQYGSSGYAPSYQPDYAPQPYAQQGYAQPYGAQSYGSQSYGQRAYSGGYQTGASYGAGGYTPWQGSPCLNPCAIPPAPPPPPPPPPPQPCLPCIPVPPPLPCNPCAGVGYGYPQTYGQGYSYNYATPGYAGGIGYGLSGGVGYGYGYGSGGYYSQRYTLPAPAYAAGYTAGGGYGGAYYSSSGYSSSSTALTGGWMKGH